jgi:hypothetical protein
MTMMTTIKVATTTAKKLKLSKVKYMSAKSLSDLTNDEYLVVLLGKNKK